MDRERSAWLGPWMHFRHTPYCLSRMVWVTWVFLAFKIYIILYRPNGKINCLAHFSENLGYICVAPLFSVNLLSFLFGRTLDAHAGKIVEDLFSTTFFTYYEAPRCLQGRDCYVDAIYLTIGVSLLSFFLSIWAGYRDSCKAAKLQMGEEDDWNCVFFKKFPLCEAANIFFGGHHSTWTNPLRILFESRLDFVRHFRLR